MEKYIALVTSCISSGSCILVFLSFFNSLEYVCTYTRYVCRYIQSMDSEFSPIILIHVQLVVDGILFRFTDNCVKKCVYVHIFLCVEQVDATTLCFCAFIVQKTNTFFKFLRSIDS